MLVRLLSDRLPTGMGASSQAKALGGVWFFYFVVLGIILWTAKFLWSFLAFYCASVSLQSAKEVSSLLELRKRKLKESFCR